MNFILENVETWFPLRIFTVFLFQIKN
jgi:hypothetical protein